jgi:sialidase-1
MKIALTISGLFIFTVLFPQQFSTVFRSGENGYSTYRIPAVIRLPDATLLAFAEGRVNSSNDFGNIDLVLKRSTDNGKTWGEQIIVADYDTLQAGNPAPVADLSDPLYPGGRIFIFYNTGNTHEGEIRKGKGCREVWYKTSTDGGLTWSDGTNITTQVHRPHNVKINPDYKFPEDWRSYANTPGHALQFETGRYKGRLYVAANHSAGEPQKESEDYSAHAYFSDDHGKTFRISQTIPIPGSNEATAAEISDNGLILNARNQKGDIRARLVARSSNGGETWESIGFDKNLPDPVCEGSILSFRDKNGKLTLAFSNAADTARRDNLSLRISYDEGITWPVMYKVDGSAGQNNSDDFTAYSDIVSISPSTIGILYERDNYNQIVFKIIQLKK